MSKLPALAGLFGPLWGDTSVPLLDEPPIGDRGPAYVLTWDLGEYVDEAEQSTGSPDLVRQTVYPYAAGSPLVHTEAGQPFYAEETSGGWYVAHPALRDMLISLGLPTTLEAQELAAASPAGGDAGGILPADDGDAGWTLPVAVAVAGLAALSATAFGMARRRTA